MERIKGLTTNHSVTILLNATQIKFVTISYTKEEKNTKK